MRSEYSNNGKVLSDVKMGELATDASGWSMDAYSDYGVGAVVEMVVEAPSMDSYHAFQGTNINISGMEQKIHAEQLAMFQALLFIESNNLRGEAELGRVVVHTTENDHSLLCGHCLQVLHGVCYHLGQEAGLVEYDSVTAKNLEGRRGMPEGVEYDFERHTVDELLSDSYVLNRSDN